MKQSPKDVIVASFRQSVDDVFSFHGGDETDYDPTVAEFAVSYLFDNCEPEEMVSAKISLQGDSVNCSAYLVAMSETIEEVAQAVVVCSLDWIGELSNLLLGSFKNKLWEYNIESQLGLPSTRPGIHIESTVGSGARDAVVVRTIAGDILVVLNFYYPKDAFWEHNPDQSSAEDGSVSLF